MSSSALPITPQRFAEAILDLPLPSLHLKAAEIRNSISHLESSNSQLQIFADDGDKDCEDALTENKDTMLRMEERILMLRREVERRGFELIDDIPTGWHDSQDKSNGHVETTQGRAGEGSTNPRLDGNNVSIHHRQNDGSPGLGTSPRNLVERAGSDDEELDHGVHL